MNIQELLKTYQGSIVRVMNWENNKWLFWDGTTEKYCVLECEDRNQMGKMILSTDDEEEAVAELVKGTNDWFKN